jgi:predicted NBD/HSP70 family sugar kinase
VFWEGVNVKPPFQLISEINRLAVLRSISRRESFTKMDVVRDAHLSLPTVSDIIATLHAEGYVLPKGNGESRGGRPPALFRFNPTAKFAFGINVDPPTIAIGLIDLQFKLHAVTEYPFNDDSTPEYIEATLTQGIADILLKQRIDPNKVVSISIGVPGYLDRDTGTWLGYLPLGSFTPLPLRELLSRRFGAPVHIQHASSIYTFAEMQKSPGAWPRDALVVICSEGVKASVVVDGRILSGDHGNFGRVGHLVVVDNGRRCYCGAKGCLEMYASGRSLREYIRSNPLTIAGLSDLNDPALPYRVFQLAAEGNRTCRQIVEDMIPHMAHAFAALINLTDIGHIVLLGAYAEGGTYLADLLQQDISQRLPKVTGVRLFVRAGHRLTLEDLVVSAAMPVIQRHLGVQIPTIHLD